ncbi:ECF transporter S component [Parvimonas sp. C2]|uniref:ECF transporter S component n=1 Tax=Parvimonas sp. C2 TaxID=3110692 RepID=UPI002B48E7AF|nr:ECF transporter S component [Parvimonas sp. C2]MEB3073247.1 ECF transporter S component [Parvimonas sp. C2]
MENKLNIKKITLIGVMAAVVFVASQIQIRIPLGASETRVHIGNGFCLLCGLLLGPFAGGLASGMGSAIFDIINPIYLPSAPFTFIFKFLMAFICGKIAYSNASKAEDFTKNLTGSITGAVTYVILYLSKSYISDIYVKGLPQAGAIAKGLQRLGASTTNAIVGVIIAVLLAKTLQPILKKAIR